jgi:hypothetical protein
MYPEWMGGGRVAQTGKVENVYILVGKIESKLSCKSTRYRFKDIIRMYLTEMVCFYVLDYFWLG